MLYLISSPASGFGREGIRDQNSIRDDVLKMTKINSSAFGSITINDVVYRHDVYILPSGKVEERQYGHTFAKEQIEHVLKEEPDTVVIGKGAFGMASLSSDARVLLGRKGIEIAEAATIDTIDESNKPSEIKKVAAILHVPC